MRHAARVVDRAADLDFDPRALPPLPPRGRIVMADPAHFDVTYVINPHMAGHVGGVDRALAREQWVGVKRAFGALGFEVAVVPPAPGLPDLVFTANQSFPGRLPDGAPIAVLSHMANPERRPEEAVLQAWYATQGIPTTRLPGVEGVHEGMGDAEWLPGHRVVVAGWGFRTDPKAWDALSALLDVPVLRVRLVDERFYHLDTALQLLTADKALYVPEAFDDAGRALLAAAIPNLVPVPLAEAAGRFSVNGYAPDGQHYIVHHGSPETTARVRDLGLEVVEVDTSEFLKSGGSVYCMKLHLH